jgi:hypothetical protein
MGGPVSVLVDVHQCVVVELVRQAMEGEQTWYRLPYLPRTHGPYVHAQLGSEIPLEHLATMGADTSGEFHQSGVSFCGKLIKQ